MHKTLKWNSPVVGAVVSTAFAIAGCSSLKPVADATTLAQPAPGASQAWQYPASEFPTMCLVLERGGNARFVGGFLYFNPSSWRMDPSSGLTVLMVGGGKLPMAPASLAPPTAAGAKTAVARVDEDARTVSYRIDSHTNAIDFGGFAFFRTDRCTAP